jgi:hypothetical protein
VDPGHLTLWPFDRGAFFGRLARAMGLRGTLRTVGSDLWQLGSWARGDEVLECFFVLGAPSEEEVVRVTAYRWVLLLYGLRPPVGMERLPGIRLSLLALLRGDIPLTVADLPPLLRDRGPVRFDRHSGALWVSDRCLGELPPGSKEFAFIAALAADLDRFVPYADLKRAVLRESASTHSTEEATSARSSRAR